MIDEAAAAVERPGDLVGFPHFELNHLALKALREADYAAQQQAAESLTVVVGIDGEGAEMQLIDHVPDAEVGEEPVMAVDQRVEDAD